MIITRIIGGLGNQMFQYALGRSLALTVGSELRLDIAGFHGYGLHQGYELDRFFDLPAHVASDADVRSVLGWRGYLPFRNLLRHRYLSALRSARFVVEPTFHYWTDILNAKGDCYLVGYWQSEKYFSNIRNVIRSEFTYSSELAGKNAELALRISDCNAVSLHVRRGDYASNPKTNAVHGLCSLEYYGRAISYIAERVASPVFFVFSDDIPWVKKNLNIGFPCKYVDHNNGSESYNDMRLMSLCQHHIIANSSFSWWGAWLNPRSDKHVVAPQRWFVHDVRTDDLIPGEWVTL